MLAFYVNRRKDLNWEFPLANNCCLQELRHTHISHTSDLRQTLHFFCVAILTQTFHWLAFLTQTFRRVVCLWFLWLGRRLPKVPNNLRWTIVNKHWFFVNILFVVSSHICFKIFVPQRRRTKKFYLALLRGHVKEDRVDIDIPIGEKAIVMLIVNFNLRKVFFLQMNTLY